jgi:hypothetical protein
MYRHRVDEAMHDAWALVVRVAVAFSLLAAAAGAALYRFAGASPVAIVVVVAAVGAAVGSRLPAARPHSRSRSDRLASIDGP